MNEGQDISWSSVEGNLADVANDFSVFDLLNPINERHQRELFENNEVRNPDFLYPEPGFEPEQKAENINSIEVPEGQFENQFERRVHRQRLRNLIIKHRGDREKVIFASSCIYGIPDQGLVEHSEKLLEKHPDKERDKPATPEDVRSALECAMSMYETEYGEDVFEDWSIVIDEGRRTGYASRSNKEFVIGDRDYLQSDPFRYVVHELGRHALLKENHDLQKQRCDGKEALRNFVYDSRDEEGVATNLERLSGVENPEILRKYALRVIAVNSLLEGDDFRDTYDELSRWESDPDLLWNTALRVHRGGGFVKDHIYLDGRMKVRNYLESGGDLKTLYIGKIPLNKTSEAEEMVRSNELRDPEYTPLLLDKNGEIRKHWC